MPSCPAVIKKILSFLTRMEELILGSLVIVMVLFGFLQILLRNFFSYSIFWIDPILRHSVLWVALLGASIATKEDRHISIDLLSEKVSPRIRSWLQAGTHLFAAMVSWLLVWPAIQFVREEYEVGKILAFGIPIWVSQTIMPVMLAVMGLRFFIKVWGGRVTDKMTFPNEK